MIIKIKNLTYICNENTPFETKALDNINLEIENGDFIGLIGHTGSGKSTLIQHLNGLIKSNEGHIEVCGIDITKKKINLKELRQKVGLVFQYPEHQLFEETIYKDIAFGPQNLGLKDEEIDMRVKEAMDLVGLDFVKMKDRSPFDLSGGQKRRVAIAGVLAMKPEVLILDEPTAGLDPKGREEILSQIQGLYTKNNMTIILVSHSMEDVAKLVNKIIVMNKGQVRLYDTPREIFKKGKELESFGLGVPQITQLMHEMKKKDENIDVDILTVEEAKVEILRYLRRRKNA